VTILETLIEELVVQSINFHVAKNAKFRMLTSEKLFEALENNFDLWGLFQSYTHLICHRRADGRFS